MAIFQHLLGHRMKSKVVIDLIRSDGDNTCDSYYCFCLL